MIRTLIILNLIINTTGLLSQESVFYPLDGYQLDSFHYSYTDYSKIDTLSFWQFKITEKDIDSTLAASQPIAEITFSRAKELADTIVSRRRSRGEIRTRIISYILEASISFEIFPLQEISPFLRRIEKVRLLSSCWPPNVGGDIVIAGELILLNHEVCFRCGYVKERIDLCRPIINHVFNKIDRNSIRSIEQLSNELEKILKREK